MTKNGKSLEIYIHIPFCVRKCAYCDFLSFPADEKTQRTYAEHLIREMLSYAEQERTSEVSTVFIGGGTPSAIPTELIQQIMECLKANFTLEPDAEITMECNPGTLTSDSLACYKNAGINRLSIGLQSADNLELKLLGRIHTWETFLNGYHMARKAGFDNINIDLITSLPGQSKESFRNTLKKVIELKPEHISAYSLIIEEGTPFYDAYAEDLHRREEGEDTCLLPSEDTEYAIGEMTKKMLEEAGYHRYEISNYAKPGKECRHNIGYWTGADYLGIGLGASGYRNGIRSRNVSDLGCYLDLTAEQQPNLPQVLMKESDKLTMQAMMEEFMFLGLRMTHGVSARDFEQRFGTSLEKVYGETLQTLIREELMQMEKEQTGGVNVGEDHRYFLTERGLDLSNYAMAMFLD